MKKLKVAIVMIFMGCLTAFPTNINNEPDINLTVQIKKMLESPEFKSTKEELNATVLLMLNANDEIVIIEVKCAETQVESFVKSRLNYKRVKPNSLLKGKIFKMPLKIVMQNRS
ncbi:hypothetical protein JBL43_07425 [Aureibaculum sp. A20]|uniref:TonB C-terminal domain-containing protein n=1 Tax=Aureibaculum flavum TaxID=2795986 RepID=A0ABS0WQ06_9FLAO|nr:hypothetical protein [Aureibaculum flavum]MBJ2174061.1 hypothetical protein [Aureibaculum flavum]